MKTKLAFFGALLLSNLLLPVTFAVAGADGGDHAGGSDPTKSNVATITMLINGGGLQNAMVNYLTTIQVDKIDNADVKATLTSLVTVDKLVADIKTKNIYAIKDGCRDGLNNQVMGMALIGQPGSPICFDVNGLAADYSNLTEEEQLIRLAALAIHEHIHHFQNPSTPIAQNEKQAYAVESYVRLTARTVEMPTLQWSATPLVDCPDLSGMYVDSKATPSEIQANSGGTVQIGKVSNNVFAINQNNMALIWTVAPGMMVPNYLFTLDGQNHVFMNDTARGGPNTDFVDSYSGYCTKDSIVIDEYNTDHDGSNLQKVGYTTTHLVFQLNGQTLNETGTEKSFDLSGRLTSDGLRAPMTYTKHN